MLGILSPEAHALLAPQERFDKLRATWLQRHATTACDLAYPNPPQPGAHVVDAIRRALGGPSPPHLQYTPYGGLTTTRRLIAEDLSEIHGAPYHWRDVVLTPGAMAALHVAMALVATGAPGEEVIVPTPCWLDYPLYLSVHGLRAVLVPLAQGSFCLDLARIEAVLSPRTRALVLSHPANPTGVLYSERELAALGKLLARAPSAPWLISDECHRSWLSPEQAFCAPVRYYDRTITTFSFGKSLLMQGQRIGYAAVSPNLEATLRRESALFLERACRAFGFCTPTTLMQLAMQELVSYRPDISSVLAARERMGSALRSQGYEVVPGTSTFFMYVRSPILDDFAFTERLATEGTFVLPASIFHHAGYFRICLTAAPQKLEQALPCFERSIRAVQRES